MVQTMVEEREVLLPPEVTAMLEGRSMTVKGPLGELKRDFSILPIHIEVLLDKVTFKSFWSTKKERALIGTAATHMKNMVKGVSKGFFYKLRIVFSHFPITVKVLPNKIQIENFIGERSPRFAKIQGNVKVNVQGDNIIVQGSNLEDVSQTAANIELSTKIKHKDARVFLDGIYIYEKSEGG